MVAELDLSFERSHLLPLSLEVFLAYLCTWHAPFLLALDAVTEVQNLVEDVSV